MFDNEYSPDKCKSSKLSTGATIKIPWMLRFVRYHLCKIIKLCKDEVKKMQFVIRYSPDRSKIHEMCKKLF